MKKLKNWWKITWTILKGLLRFANPQAVEIIDETIDEINNELNRKEDKKWVNKIS